MMNYASQQCCLRVLMLFTATTSALASVLVAVATAVAELTFAVLWTVESRTQNSNF